MHLRLTKIDEYQFLTCLKFGIWGSKSARFKEWEKGDGLVFIVGKALAAFAEVTGGAYFSKDVVWDNGLFPYRIPISFRHILSEKDRIPILGIVRQALTDSWGPRYGWGILDQQALSEDAGNIILEEIRSKPNALNQYQTEMEERMAEAKLQREAVGSKIPRKRRTRRVAKAREEPIHENITLHTKLQRQLIEIGRATGCLVWVASGDRLKAASKIGQSEYLSELPKMGLSEEATRRISYIDVIWIKQNAPICAFEIETTTSIYSGLLRMSDLLAVVPALKLDLFIVAPKDRQEKVMGELSRPTFSKLGLSEYCRFLSSEELESLADRVKGLAGHLQPSVLDTIAIALEE